MRETHQGFRSPSTIAVWALAGALGLGSAYQIHRLDGVRHEVDVLRRQAVDSSTLTRALDASLSRQLRGVENELEVIRLEIQAAADEAAEALALAQRVATAEQRLGQIGSTIEAQSSQLGDLEAAQASFGPEVDARIAEREARLIERWETLRDLVDRAQRSAERSLQGVDALGLALGPRDLRSMWRELVGPVVQLSGESSVGSGVLLRSEPMPAGDGYQTLLLTAWHVVRDIQGDLSKTDALVPTTIYGEDGSRRQELAELLTFNAELDAALLRLLTPDALANGATIAPRARLAGVRIFDQVYAVGCPLGNDPIPTHGEIATCRHEVDGETYWMINAPTYIGNSGGGIFDSETHELLGIFSKIYTHGSLRPTIVPHMGLVTPLDAIYGWLENEGYAIHDPAGGDSDVRLAIAPAPPQPR